MHTLAELVTLVWNRYCEESDPEVRYLIAEAYDKLKEAQKKQG